MRAGIHPVYETRKFHCYGCNSEWETRTTLTPATADGKVHLDICSSCHPFFTGKQKLIDKAGRVERFRRKFGKGAGTSEPGKTDPSEEAAEAVKPGTETANK
jgi:large subunit ribosomal protein L31